MAELAFCWVRVVHFTVGYFGFTENAFTYDVLLYALYRMNPSMAHAEEVSAEIVAALATSDTKRFLCVALTTADLRTLGLRAEKAKAAAAEAARARRGPRAAAARQ